MRVFSLPLVAIFGLLLSFSALPVYGQYEDLYGLSPEIGEGLSNMGFTTLRGINPDGKCQGYFNQVGVTYPFGTGSPDLDKILADQGKADFDAYLTSQMETCPENVDSTDTATAQRRKTFRSAAVGKKYLSFLYTAFESVPYAAHPNSATSATVYDLETVKTVELADIFADPKTAVPELWAFVAKGWCDQGHGTLPYHYGLSEADNFCGPKTPPLPEALKASPVPLKAFGGVMLTKNGLHIYLDAMDAWSSADGAADLEVPVDVLLTLGAKPEIWK